MKTKIFVLLAFLLLCSVVGFGELDDVFILHITLHKNDFVELHSFELTEGKVNVHPSKDGDYTLDIVSFEGDILFSEKVPINFFTYREWIDEEGNMHGELIELEKQDRYWRLPYFSNAGRIGLYHNETLIFALDIAEKVCIEDENCPDYCKGEDDPDCMASSTTIQATTTSIQLTTTVETTLCGNSVCEESESYKNCPMDCNSGGKDSYCDGVDDEICDPDCEGEEDPDCKMEEEIGYIPYAIGGIIALILIVFLANRMMRHGGSRKGDEETEKIAELVESQLRGGESPELIKKALSAEGVDTKIVDDIMGRL